MRRKDQWTGLVVGGIANLMFDHKMRLFRLAGFPVEIHPSWFVVFALVAWTFADGYLMQLYPELSPITAWTLGGIGALLLFASLLLHELGHAVTARRKGMNITSITLFIFGGVAALEDEPETAAAELEMALAGPAVSFVLAALFYLVAGPLLQLGTPAYIVDGLTYLAVVNAVIALFNLVPAYPLDGGRVLRAFAWKNTDDVRKATRIVTTSGHIVAGILFGLGVLRLFGGAIIGGIWLILIAFFLNAGARSGYVQSVLREVLAGRTVSDIMEREIVTVPMNLNLRQAVDQYFMHYRYDSFPVVNEEDDLIGMISLDNVKDVPREEWEDTRVSDAVDEDVLRFALEPGEPADEVLKSMQKAKSGRLPVVDHKEPIGIVTRRDLIDVLRIYGDVA